MIAWYSLRNMWRVRTKTDLGRRRELGRTPRKRMGSHDRIIIIRNSKSLKKELMARNKRKRGLTAPQNRGGAHTKKRRSSTEKATNSLKWTTYPRGINAASELPIGEG